MGCLRNRFARLALAVAIAVSLATPSFASPYATPTSIIAEDFESPTSASYAITPIPLTHLTPNLYYWGRIAERKHDGAAGLWVAGSSADRAEYPIGTGGQVIFDLPRLSDYYAAELRFFYTMQSRGSADSDSLRLSWYRPEDPYADQYSLSFPLTAPNEWLERSYDLANSANAKLSRTHGAVKFQFVDKVEGFGATSFVGEGPTIDDVSVSGWKYGPPRGLVATVAAGSVNLSWARPYRATTSTSTEERALAYRVWRAPAGTSSWTELTQGRLGDSVTSFSTGITTEGVQQRYSVQAWDPVGPEFGRSVDVTVTIPSAVPSVAMSSPATGFPVTLMPVVVSGTASDIGSGVSAVQVRVRRSDGLCWSPSTSSWVSADTWTSASTSNGWADWTYSWQPNEQAIAAGKVITISARSRDNSGLLSTVKQVSSSVPVPPSAVLANGAALSTEQTVTATLSAAGVTHARYSVNGSVYSAWEPFSSTMPVGLGSGDGSRTVTFQFSIDGGLNVAYTAADDIVLHSSRPDIQLATPGAGYSIIDGPVIVSGTASDASGIVSSVGVRIRRADGRCWDGSAWVAGDQWLPAMTANGFADWEYEWTPDDQIGLSGQIVTVSARATDFYGLQQTTAGVGSAVPVAASLSLDDGAAHTIDTLVQASITATGSPIRMRYSINGGPFGETIPFESSTVFGLTSGDGTKTVTLEVSNGETTATATDDIMLHSSVPDVVLMRPGGGFALVGAVPIQAVADDAGAPVQSVGIMIRRSDGWCWNGAAWQPAEVWIAGDLNSDDGSWGYLWSIDPRDVISGRTVSVFARATDAFGLTGDSDPIVSASPPAPSLTLEAGDPYSSTTTITASLSALGATHMRFGVDGQMETTWTAFSSDAEIGLPAAEGTHTVRVEYSGDGENAFGSAEQSIFLDLTGPRLSLSNPGSGFGLPGANGEPLGSIAVTGTVADAASGFSAMRVRISRTQMFWNGFGWQDDEYWLTPAVENGVWTLPWMPSAADTIGYDPVSIDVEASDLVGNTSTAHVVSVDPKEPARLVLGSASVITPYGATAWVRGNLTASSAPVAGRRVRLQYYSAGWKYVSAVLSTDASGNVAYPVRPANKTLYRLYFAEDADYLPAGPTGAVTVTPKVYLSAPFAPSTARRRVAFTSSGILRPRHSSGYTVRIYKERYVSGKWRSYGYTAVRSSAYSSYSKYSGRITLSYAGKWRLRAYVPADSAHASTYGAYSRTIVVR